MEMVYNKGMKTSALNIVFLSVFILMFVGTLFLIRAQFEVGGSYVGLTPSDSDETQEVTSPIANVALANFVNIKGQAWRLPKESKTGFTATTKADHYPRFVSGVIEPLDVHPGDIQKMTVTIDNTGPLKRVWAVIETDGPAVTVDLTLTASTPISFRDTEQRPYVVTEVGELIPNVPASPFAETLIAKARAESAMQYIYNGEWKVFNTHSKNYKTIFYAKDALGNTENLTLAWSDPCTPPLQGGDWLADSACSFSFTNGVQGGNVTVATGTSITISTGATFVFNPGYSVSIIGNGYMTKISGGKMQKTQLWALDCDADNYVSSTHFLAGDVAPNALLNCPGGTGMAPMKKFAGLWNSIKESITSDLKNVVIPDVFGADLAGGPTATSSARVLQGAQIFGIDCDDYSSFAYPGTPNWLKLPMFPSDPNSFDYNCDGTVQKQSINFATGFGMTSPACNASTACITSSTPCGSGTPGWKLSIPICGDTGGGNWLTGCSSPTLDNGCPSYPNQASSSYSCRSSAQTFDINFFQRCH